MRKRQRYGHTAYWVMVRDELTSEIIEKHSFPSLKQAQVRRDTSSSKHTWGRPVKVDIEAHPTRQVM